MKCNTYLGTGWNAFVSLFPKAERDDSIIACLQRLTFMEMSKIDVITCSHCLKSGLSHAS